VNWSARRVACSLFPSVLAAGFIVGGEYGKVALRVGGSSVGYYSTTSGSFGLQARRAIESHHLPVHDAGLTRQIPQYGRLVGGRDASVALVKMGANGNIDSTTGLRRRSKCRAHERRPDGEPLAGRPRALRV